MDSIESHGCESIQIAIGPDKLSAESVPARIFAERERTTMLGASYEQWLAAGEACEDTFLLPHASTLDQGRISHTFGLSIKLDDRGQPIGALTDDRTLFGRAHPFSGFLRTSLRQCRRVRAPLCFDIQLKLHHKTSRHARLLLPSVDDNDCITRIDIVQRTENSVRNSGVTH